MEIIPKCHSCILPYQHYILDGNNTITRKNWALYSWLWGIVHFFFDINFFGKILQVYEFIKIKHYIFQTYGVEVNFNS